MGPRCRHGVEPITLLVFFLLFFYFLFALSISFRTIHRALKIVFFFGYCYQSVNSVNKVPLYKGMAQLSRVALV